MWRGTKAWVEDGRRRDNNMGSVHYSWESSSFLSQEVERPSEEVIYFSSWDGNLRVVWRTPVESLRCALQGLLSLSSSPYSHGCSLSDLYQRLATSFFGSGEWGGGGGRKRNSGVAHIWSHLFPALRSNSIHRTSSSFARLHLAISASYKLSRFALETPPRLVRLHRGERTSSYPSPLHYQRSHYTLVIKIATCPPPFLLVFFFHHSISLYQRTSGANVLADTFTPPGLEWIIVRQGSRVT